METKKIIEEFLKCLNEEYLYLNKTREFFKRLENNFKHKDIISFDFENIIQEFEIKAEFYLKMKEEMILKVSRALSIDNSRVSFKLLINLGYTEFRVLSNNINKINMELRKLLLKFSVYLKTFADFNENEKRINQYVSQKNYSIKTVNAENNEYLTCLNWEV